jgi:O-acetyl-ADP-ribose deacetylase (regulator of RNase III)
MVEKFNMSVTRIKPQKGDIIRIHVDAVVNTAIPHFRRWKSR